MADDKEPDDGQPLSNANLEDVFEGKDEETDKVGAEPAKNPDQKPNPKGEEGDEAEEGDETNAETPTAEDEYEGKSSVPVAALKAERSKRQAAEAKLDELSKKHAPEKSIDELETEKTRFEHRTEVSRDLMIEAHADYADMEKIFAEIAKDDPELIAEMVASKNPAKFAYETAMKHPKGQEYSEFLEFRKAKAKAAGQKDGKTEKTSAQKRNESVLAVPNINKAASVSSNSTPKESLESLDEMFGD